MHLPSTTIYMITFLLLGDFNCEVTEGLVRKAKKKYFKALALSVKDVIDKKNFGKHLNHCLLKKVNKLITLH